MYLVDVGYMWFGYVGIGCGLGDNCGICGIVGRYVGYWYFGYIISNILIYTVSTTCVKVLMPHVVSATQ